MRPVARALLALGAAGCAALGPAVSAAAGSGTVTTGPSAEGWHRTAPTCGLPTGCPELPSPYAPDTLHVGVNAGLEEARTTLQLDLTTLPAGTKPAGGQLRLPVATGPQDGTRAPETARLRACLLTEAVEDVDGSFAPPPTPDCETASVDAEYVAASAEAPAAFTVDLGPLALAWQDAAAPGALALVPGDVAPTDEWHVAFSDRTRTGEGVARTTAAVTFVAAAVDSAQEELPPVQAPVDDGFAPAPAFELPDSGFAAAPVADVPVALPDLPAAAPQRAGAAPQAAPAAVVPVSSVVDAGFRYPAVFLLPLLLVGAAAWIGRALTRDLTQV